MHDLHFRPMTEAHARNVLSWRYEGAYAFYNIKGEPEEILPEMLNGSQWAIERGGELIGFVALGAVAQVPGGWSSGVYERYPGLDVGLGMRPDLTGRGMGAEFVAACISFAREEAKPEELRLVVATFNRRAITVYERVGFRRGPTFRSGTPGGDTEFLLMTLPLTGVGTGGR